MAGSLSASVSQALQVYIKGTKAWFEDSQEAWVSATVISKEESATTVKIFFENDQDPERKHVFESSLTLLEKQKGANLPPLKNPPRMDTIDDLTNLTFLNEPSVLDTIRTRYLQRHIYTYSGIVLIAANPFARVPLYEAEVIQRYSGKRRGELDPHLFAIAEDAYRFMVREKTNQTVVVSGESGAGKTVSATHIMRYFATADDQESGKVKDVSKGMTEVEEQIMATNPIMEAFGNAKTTRNNNSSRFGKYIEIQFDVGNNIVGAKIRTYLLERSRLNFQPETERNYHIFYQVCSGSSADEKKRLGLGDWNQFHYLNQSGTGSIPGVDDVAEFKLTQESLSLVGISSEQQSQIFQLLAALLHIGNIQVGGRTDAAIADNDPALLQTTQLLGIVKTAEFKKWLTRRQIITRSDKIVKNLSIVQSLVVRDSVAKYIYASLFDWLVKVVNDSLSCQEEGKARTFIGVLDIYGFEHFKKNSFEQFCINYANEKLQQQFNQHVFKLEQEEYIKEKIEWKFIEFSDNQKCIEVIEAKLGILSLLDEESRMPSGTDQGFCNKLFSNFSDPKYKQYFKKPRFSNSAFTVCHYAHEVEYESEGFIDKNKDTVPDELLNLLQTAQSPFLVEMLQEATAAAAATSQESKPTPVKKVGMAIAKKPTLGSIFKLSLISLMDTINKTNVHYIRCIKPNEAKVAWGFEANMVLSQLRACGVLETIRISCLGYPSRWEFEEFAERFYALLPSKYWYKMKPESRELCGLILNKCIKDKDKYQVGLSKLFFRAGQLAFLEKCRREKWDECTILVQKNGKRLITRIRYLKTLDLVHRLQRVGRQKMGVLKLERTRQNKAAVKIQTEWRRYIQRQRYLKQCAFIVQLQTVCRRRVMRHQFRHIREHRAAVKIQSLLRGWALRREFLDRRKHVIKIQACVRRRLARGRFLKLKEQAKALGTTRPATVDLEQDNKQNIRQDNRQNIRQDNRQNIRQDNRQDIRQEIRQDIRQNIRQDNRQEIWQENRQDNRQNEVVNQVNSWMNKHETERDFEEPREPQRTTIPKEEEDSDIEILKAQIAGLRAKLTPILGESRASPRRVRTDRRGITSVKQGKRILFAQPEQMIPKHTQRQPESVVIQLLQKDADLLEREMVELIQTVRMVPPGGPREHVFFSVHLIGQSIAHIWRLGFIPESERLLMRISKTIEQECASFTQQDALVPCAYWLSNTHELLSLIHSTRTGPEKVMTEARDELERLQDKIYYRAMTELKRELSQLIIPALIESQSLPGFFANEMFSRLTMDDLLESMDGIYQTLRGYYLDPQVIEQAIGELLKWVGITAFNDLIMRRHFNSWRRAMQIQYNITRLEEWCEGRGMKQVMSQLEHLVQAIKLLLLEKGNEKDAQRIFDICWFLKPIQIQKLIQDYHMTEHEQPMGQDLLRAVTSRVTTQADVLLEYSDDCDYDQPEPYQVNMNPYIPDYLNIQRVQKLMAISQM